MAAKTGLCQFLDWGASTTIASSMGKVTGGSITYDSAVTHREGIGAQDDMVGGPIPLGGSADIILQNEALVAYALRSAYTCPSLTEFCVAGGEFADARKQTGCKVNTLGLSCSIGEPLTASFEWMATGDAAYSTAAQAYDTEYTWEWFTATASVAANAALEVQSFEISLNNNCEQIWTLDTATGDQKRWPDYIKVGSQEVTVSVEALVMQHATTPAAVIQDTLATDLTCVFTFLGGTSGTDTMTITTSNLARATAGVPWTVGGSLVAYPYTFEAKKDASSLTVSVAAA